MLRCEIWQVDLDPTVGAEMQKSRPALIVSSDVMGALPLRVIVPITEWKDRYQQAAWMVKLMPSVQNRLVKPSAVDAFQLRAVSITRFVRKMGDINQEDMDQVVHAIGLVVEHPQNS